MNIYEAVKFRYSNKKYLNEKIDEKLYNDIKNHIDEAYPLFNDVRYSIDIVNLLEDDRYKSSYMGIKSPYYLCMNSGNEIKSYINAGYMLENIALYLTVRGISSSFVDTYKIKLVEKDGMEPVVLFAFGKAKEIAYRDCKYAKRLLLDKLAYGHHDSQEIIQEMLEYARLAPSAYNAQPWRFEVDEDRINIFIVKTMFGSEKASLIGVGIALANMLVVAEEKWQDAHVEYNKCAPKHFKNGKYICSVVLEKGANSILD